MDARLIIATVGFLPRGGGGGKVYFGQGVMGGRADWCGVTFFFGALFFWREGEKENGLPHYVISLRGAFALDA